MKTYDLAIIGSGPGGYVAALYASRRNMKVCVIEKDLVGGTCLNRGCIPTKSMLNSAALLSSLKLAASFGIEIQSFKLNLSAVVSRKDSVVNRLRAGIESLFKARHVDLIRGTARFKDPNTIRVDGFEDIKAANIIIAVGSRPMVLSGIPIDETRVYSSDQIWNMDKLPASIAIIGGGAIGVESATLFNSFGTKVTLIELMNRLIPTQSREVSKKLELVFRKRGVEILTSTMVESIAAGESLTIKHAGGRELSVDKALVSVGRRANIEDIGIEELGIQTLKGKIDVDKHLRTNLKNIYAIGDCIPGPLLAHKASYDAIVACDNILETNRDVDYSNIPSCIFTDPEIASVGLNEEEARQRSPDTRIAKFPYQASGKAAVIGRQEGFIKMIGDPSGNILGIEIFGAEACDLIGEAVVAKAVGMNIKDLAHVVHAHPTLSEIFQEAAHIFCGTAIHTL